MTFTQISRLIPLAFLLGTVLCACTIDEQTDPNGPSINSVAADASITELNLLVGGIEARTRNGYTSYVTATGTIARELYIFDADPRNTEDLLGKDDLVLDNNTFYLTQPFGSRYRVVKNANVLLDAVDNTSAITAAQAAGYRGFANTMKAWMLSQVLDLLNTNGVRVDVDDPNDLGPFLNKEASVDAILALFDEAATQLSGAEFAFNLSAGFADFDTPAAFAEVNRALAARVATRAGRYTAALGYVEDSFLSLEGELTTGPKHIFSTNANDLLNPLFRAPGQSGDQLIVHPRIIDGLEAGDLRASKWRARVDATSQDGLNGDFETALFASAISPIDIIRNEELILIWAEANLQTGDLTDALSGINAVRNAAGLPDFSGDANSPEALTDELLQQRTYSFWGEGHQMFDLRRYGRLNSDFLPIDRPGDDVFTEFPIPLSEGV